MDAILKGLQILNQYEGAQLAAERDLLYVTTERPFEVTSEHKSELERLHWRFDTEIGIWRKFI